MKHALTITAILVAFSAQAQTVDRKACQTTYASTVSTCAQGLNALAPNVRAGAQKACVQGSQTARDVCLAGTPPPTCQDSCQASYSITVTQCETIYNPDFCGPVNPVCQQQQLQLRTACTLAATDVFNACVTGCGVTP